jgi:opacity protein-like surface antigen
MKYRFLAGAAVTAIMASSAFAADMPLKAAPPPVLAYDWSGIYIGGVIGGGWATHDVSDPGLGILGTLVGVPVIQTTNSSGFIGGVEGGDRYQFGKLVALVIENDGNF